MHWRKIIVLCLAALPWLATGSRAQTVLGDESRDALTLTVTQGAPSLVSERRHADLAAGDQALVIEPVARRVRVDSGSLSAAGVTVLSQQWDVNGIDAANLLAAHRGKDVTVIWRGANGSEREERATVLATDGQPVFRIGGRVVSGQPERVVYDTLPPGLRAVAAYGADIHADKSGKRTLELSYMTDGLSWQPAYVVEMNGSGKAMLSSWAELRNDSGVDFINAHIRMIAGDMNVTPAAPLRLNRLEKSMMAASVAADNGSAPQALGPYHIYDLSRPLSLRDGESTQVPLLAPVRLNAERRLELPPLPLHAWAGRFADDAPQHPDAVLALRNTSDQPLPAGPVHLFQRGKDGGLAPTGADRLPMVPTGAPFRLTLGRAFDVTAQRVQTDVEKISPEITETAWEVRLNNAGADPAKVLISEVFSGEWLVLEESQRHEKSDATHAGWTVDIPARDEAVLRYRVRIKM